MHNLGHTKRPTALTLYTHFPGYLGAILGCNLKFKCQVRYFKRRKSTVNTRAGCNVENERPGPPRILGSDAYVTGPRNSRG